MTTPDPTPEPAAASGSTRREVLRSAGAVGGALAAAAALTACGGSSSAAGSGSGATSGGGGAAASGGGSAGSVAKSKVPVGSGIIDDNLQSVITQPTSGQFKAFDYLCTHQQCPLAQVSGAKIICDCHGSEFSITDGSVLQGPATQPLAKKTATVKGSQVVIS